MLAIAALVLTPVFLVAVAALVAMNVRDMAAATSDETEVEATR